MQEENNAVNSPNLDGQGRRSVVDRLKTTSPFNALSLVALGMAGIYGFNAYFGFEHGEPNIGSYYSIVALGYATVSSALQFAKMNFEKLHPAHKNPPVHENLWFEVNGVRKYYTPKDILNPVK